MHRLKSQEIGEYRILAFGDSNTFGYISGEDDYSRFGNDVRWPRVLNKLLGSEYCVIEEGLTGRTAAFEDFVSEGRCGLNYIVPCTESHAPLDLIIIMLGTNDLKQQYGATPEIISRGIMRLAKRAEQANCWRKTPNLLIVAPLCISKEYSCALCAGTFGEGCYEKSVQLPAKLETHAAKQGYAFFDANRIPDMVTQKLDGIHLTAESHLKLASALFEKILDIRMN